MPHGFPSHAPSLHSLSPVLFLSLSLERLEKALEKKKRDKNPNNSSSKIRKVTYEFQAAR